MLWLLQAGVYDGMNSNFLRKITKQLLLWYFLQKKKSRSVIEPIVSHPIFLMLCFYGKCIYNGTGKNPVNFTEIIIMPPCARAIVCFSWKQPPIGALVPRVLLIRVSIKLKICTYFFTTCKAKLFLKKNFLEIQIHDVQRGIY